MPDDTQNILLIFVKNPVAGRVKTRLARDIGDERARQVYCRLLKLTRRVTDRISARRQLWYSDRIDPADDWPETLYRKRLQQGAGLGERMHHAFRQVFAEGAAKAVIIGSDCPGLRQEHITQAYKALDSHDVVVGPSADGGYYLLGMNRLLPELFEEIPWSTDRVLPQTLQRCRRLGLSRHRLDTLNDIDTKADWEAYQEQLK